MAQETREELVPATISKGIIEDSYDDDEEDWESAEEEEDSEIEETIDNTNALKKTGRRPKDEGNTCEGTKKPSGKYFDDDEEFDLNMGKAERAQTNNMPKTVAFGADEKSARQANKICETLS